jgi:hypothetical protein
MRDRNAKKSQFQVETLEGRATLSSLAPAAPTTAEVTTSQTDPKFQVMGVLTIGSDKIPVLIQSASTVSFHIIDSTSNFVVKYAVRDDGVVVLNLPHGQQDKDLVAATLTSTSPQLTHSFSLLGFFTPRS